MAESSVFEQKMELLESYRERNRTGKLGQTVFVGSSLMEMFPIEEFMAELGEGAPVVYNRGLGGFRTRDLERVLDIACKDLQPSTIFINIGTNDLSDPEITVEEMIGRYREILEELLKDDRELERVFLMAYYPVNIDVADPSIVENLRVRTNAKINEANRMVSIMARQLDDLYDGIRIRFVDLNDPLKDAQGRLKAEYTIEGMHIRPEGYRAIFPAVLSLIREG